MAEAENGGRPALDVLYEHHALIGSILSALVAGDEPLEVLVHELFVELRVHSILEQQLFFPTVLSVLGRERIRRCGMDFYTMLALMLELEQMDPADEQFARNLTTIAQRFRQHVSDLENVLIPEVLSSPAEIDFQSLTARLAARKSELNDKMRSRMKPRRKNEHPAFAVPAITKHFAA